MVTRFTHQHQKFHKDSFPAMDEIYHIIGDDLWKLPESSSVDVIQATEFWLHHETNKVKATTRKIEPIHREAWLNERKRGTGPTAESLLVRIVWVVASTETISLSTSAQTVLFKRFGLQLAGKYFRTFYSGVAALPRVFKPEFDQRAYAFCYGPKIGATWSHSIFKGSSAGECITECLIFSRAPPKREKESTEHSTPDKDELKELQRFLEKVPWNAEICRSSAFPAYLFSLILSRDISETQAKIVKSIRTIESLTGFHEYANRKDGIDDNEQSLVDWSGECSGHAAKLASATRKAQVLRKLLEFITKTVDEDAKFQSGLVPPSGDEDSGPNGGSLLKANVELLQNRLDMQQIEVEHTLKRAEIQIEAVSSLLYSLLGILNIILTDLCSYFRSSRSATPSTPIRWRSGQRTFHGRASGMLRR